MLASCTPPEIQISMAREDGRQVITLIQDWGLIFSDKKPPCVDRIDLPAAGKNGSNLAWRIQTVGSECLELSSFTIGTAPSGFREAVALKSGSRGNYQLVVWGIGVGSAQVSLP
jgi:hypothetical protein